MQFLHTFFIKISSIIVGTLVAIGLVSSPKITPSQPSVSIIDNATTSIILKEQTAPEVKVKSSEKENFKETISISKPAFLSSQTPTKTEETKTTSITTLPSGAVVEMDVNGNILRYIYQPVKETTPSFRHVIVSAPQYASKEIKENMKDVSLVSLRLQSSGDAPAIVESIKIRVIGSVKAIKTVKITSCGNAQVLDEKGEVTLFCSLNIPNGTSKNYEIAADFIGDLLSEYGKTIQVSVESISAGDAVISGEFPILSTSYKIGSPYADYVFVTTKNYYFTDDREYVNITANRKVFVKSIIWQYEGSGGSNPGNLYFQGAKACIGSICTDNYQYDHNNFKGIKFYFDNIVINADETKEIKLIADNLPFEGDGKNNRFYFGGIDNFEILTENEYLLERQNIVLRKDS